MTLDDILNKIGNVTFKDLICQADVKTEEQVRKYQSRSYMIDLTADEFMNRFPLLPIEKIFYGPSVAIPSLYFNSETLAVTPIMIPFLVNQELGGGSYTQEKYLCAIRDAENNVQRGNFYAAGIHLPGAAQMEYLNLLVQKAQPPNLYSIFSQIYRTSDYGFSFLSPETIEAVIASKTEEEMKITEKAMRDLPEEIRIFRGGNSRSMPYRSAYSWTIDLSMANFFATRLGHETGYIACGRIRKEDVIEFFPDSPEKEVLINPCSQSFHVDEVIVVKGIDYLEKVLPASVTCYHKYRNELMKLDFSMESAAHGMEHEARVLLLCILLGSELKLSEADLQILCTAAIYHDTRRDNDEVDYEHGAKSCKYYVSNVDQADPFVEFLCTYHCLPDEDGYTHIQNDPVLAQQAIRAKQLIDAFKDADALDRVRFGIQDVDLDQLRYPASKSMVLVARLLLENIKI